MKYISTKEKTKLNFIKVILNTIGRKKGLFIPNVNIKIRIKKLILKLRDKEFSYYVTYILSKYMTKKEFIKMDIKNIVSESFKNIKGFNIKKLNFLDKYIYLFKLSEGNTKSFKDISMPLIVNIINKLYNNKTNFICATSGDTGSACEDVFINKKNSSVFVFSPFKRISIYQQYQMFKNYNNNIFNISIIGNFNHCQTILKDSLVKFNLNTLNSINWLRIIVQISYYLFLYILLYSNNIVKDISIYIPTGNFGNVYSAYISKIIGIPFDKIIFSTNENSYLVDIFNLKNNKENIRYTNSPSMDITIPSNFERYIYNEFNNNLSKYIKKNTKILFNKKIILKGNSTNKKYRAKAIINIFKLNNIYIDTHTANAINSSRFFKSRNKIILETAKPIKVIDSINNIINIRIKKIILKKKYYLFIRKDKNKIYAFLNINIIR